MDKSLSHQVSSYELPEHKLINPHELLLDSKKTDFDPNDFNTMVCENKACKNHNKSKVHMFQFASLEEPRPDGCLDCDNIGKCESEGCNNLFLKYIPHPSDETILIPRITNLCIAHCQIESSKLYQNETYVTKCVSCKDNHMISFSKKENPIPRNCIKYAGIKCCECLDCHNLFCLNKVNENEEVFPRLTMLCASHCNIPDNQIYSKIGF